MTIKEIKYGLIAVRIPYDEDKKRVVHFCGYQEPISEEDIIDLYRELSEDEEFGMTNLIPYEDYILEKTSEEVLEFFKKGMENATYD